MLKEKRFSFADFEIDGARRRLFKEGKPVALNSKTFDLLLVLVGRRGEILSKDELLEIVWEGQFVEEGNLPVHISTLRKILGEKKDEHQFIITFPGRGYSFVAELKEEDLGETIVESHSLTQIVVEEEISDKETQEERRGEGEKERRREEIQLVEESSASPRLRVSASQKIIIALIALIALGTGGYFLRNSFAGKSTAAFQQISIRQVTSKGAVSSAALSPDGRLFVFSLIEGDQESLWLGYIDGGEPVQIRPPAALIYLNLKFTPDGSGLYYSAGENYGGGTLYKMPVLGGTSEKIHDDVGRFSFTPDGRHFAFISSDEKSKKTRLMTADAQGGSEQEIAILPNETASGWNSPAWSPDGSTIALAASIKPYDVRLFVVNVKDGAVKPLTTYTWRAISALNWNKEGNGLVGVGIEQKSLLQQIWFISFPDGEVRHLTTDLSEYAFYTSFSNDNSFLALEGISQSNIWVAPAANLSQAKQITFGSPGRRDGWFGLAWTTDGRILYSASNSDGTSIWIMNADGTKQRQLIPKGGVNNFPSVTADGRYLVFQSNRSGHYAIWRSNLEGENMIQLTGDQIAGQPYVSPDGKWIIYNSNDDGDGELYRISIDGGDPLRLTDKPAAWAQISPDSQFIASFINTGGKGKLAVFSIDGGEPLKTFDMPRLANLRQGVHWTPDGKALTYRDWKNGIWRQNLDGGEPQRIENLPEEKLGGFGWSPDGKFFAYTRVLSSRDVVLISEAK